MLMMVSSYMAIWGTVDKQMLAGDGNRTGKHKPSFKLLRNASKVNSHDYAICNSELLHSHIQLWIIAYTLHIATTQMT